MGKNELDLSHIVVDLSEKSDEELKDILNTLCDEEERISFRRRVLHGKIDILRAELGDRMKQKREKGESIISGSDIERLTEILAKGFSSVSRVDLAKDTTD
ncbi:MAG: RsiG family protein [Candidatus Aquicultorales bacterium]